MAIDIIHRPRPVLPEPPAPADLELQFDGLQGVRDELADLLTDPFFEPLRAGIDAQLARLYRALTAPTTLDLVARRALAIDELVRDHDELHSAACGCLDAFDAPAGAGDDVESYRG